MTEPIIERVARRFRLADLLDYETAENTFDFLTRAIVWRIRQKDKPGIEHDALLARRAEEPFSRLALFLYLAKHDEAFFDLARRMTAQTLRRTLGNTPVQVALIAAQLLTMQRPRQKATVSTRDALIVMAVGVIGQLGRKPYAKDGGAQMLLAGLKRHGVNMSEDALIGVLKVQADKLEKVGFSRKEALDFFAESSPMPDPS